MQLPDKLSNADIVCDVFRNVQNEIESLVDDTVLEQAFEGALTSKIHSVISPL